jgi:hypothetical protein
MNPWSLPSPLDVLAVAVLHVLRTIMEGVLLISGNVAELGWGYLIAYWAAVLALLQLGWWGSHQTVKVRKGNDVWEFDPTRRGAAWLGAAGWWLTFRVRWQAYAAVLAELAGYGGALALLVVGVLWRWLLLAGALLLAARVLRWKRARVYARRFA